MTLPRTGCAYLDDPGTVLAFAHRGGDATPETRGLENTMTAFRAAVALGFRYLETDVHATRDGVLMAFHDTSLDRLSDRRGLISELSYDEVSAARIGESERIPTLAELFDAFPEVRFNIDIKSAGAVVPLATFIEERRAADRVLVGSWSWRRLVEFRRLTGHLVPTSAAPLETVLFMFLPARLADLLTGRRVRALQVPHRRGPLTVVSPRFVRRMHGILKHVHVWTIDDAEEMRVLLDRGVDGLMSDRIDILKSVLQERGQWRDEA